MRDIERARQALYHLSPQCARERWVRILMAAKAAGIDGGTAHEWSAQADNYKGARDF